MNKYVAIACVVVGAFLLGYYLMPTKVITETKEVVRYVKVNTHSVTVTKPDGTSVTTTNSVSNSTEHENSHTKTEINVRDTTVIGFIGLGRDNKYAGAMLQKDILGSLGVAVGLSYEVKNKDLIGIVGVSVKW